VTIVARVTGTGALTGSASVTADQSDPDPQNNQAQLTTSVPSTAGGGADLRLALAAPGHARVGGTIHYVAQVRNRGPQEATSVKLSEQIPAQARLLRLNVSRGTCATGGGSGGGSSASLTCSLGNLRPGAEARLSIVVQATAAGSLTNSVTVTADQSDPNTQNNQAQATTTVAGSPPASSGANLRLELSGPRHARGGSLIRYVAHIRNRGPAEATSVTLSDDFSSAVARVRSVTASQGTCAPSVAATGTTAAGATVTGKTAAGKPITVPTAAVASCAIGTLAPGAEARVIFVVRAHSRGRVTVRVSVSADGSDPNIANNRASVTTQLTGFGHKAHGRDRAAGNHKAKAKGDHKDKD
jgi:uncharacterized repeat protein (TIGR01451 family)